MGDKKEIEVISGDGSNLDISPVHDYLNTVKPKSSKDKPSCVIVPKEQHKNRKIKNKKDVKKEEN